MQSLSGGESDCRRALLFAGHHYSTGVQGCACRTDCVVRYISPYRIVNADHPGGANLLPENSETRGPHQIHLDNMARQIADGTADYTIAEDSLKALEICDAAYRSSFHQCRVNLPLGEFVPPPARDWHPGQPYADTGGGRNGRRLPGRP